MSKRSLAIVRGPRRGFVLLGPLMAAIVGVGACSPPGSAPDSDSDGDTAVSTELGTEPITLEMYAETGFPLAKALADEFSRQHPDVTFNVREDQFTVLVENAPRVLSADNAPDIIRLPTMVDLVKDSLLKNLDPYFDAYGWDRWPASQLVQLRVSEDGPRGSGSLYALGLGYSVTGVFYNRDQAEQIGRTEPPATIADFEDLLARAEDDGLLPIMQFNKNTAGSAVFMFNGDWESANLDKGMPENVGFFLFPPETEGGRYVAMSAPNTFGIGANAENPDAAAFFLNWVHTNEEARRISVEVGGSSPGGPADLPVPSAEEGTVLAQTLAASQQLAADNGAVDFTANATGAIFAAAITPEL
jgi:ABC-type glycerol-3-phosphate transport system substrate-binding protein